MNRHDSSCKRGFVVALWCCIVLGAVTNSHYSVVNHDSFAQELLRNLTMGLTDSDQCKHSDHQFNFLHQKLVSCSQEQVDGDFVDVGPNSIELIIFATRLNKVMKARRRIWVGEFTSDHENKFGFSHPIQQRIYVSNSSGQLFDHLADFDLSHSDVNLVQINTLEDLFVVPAIAILRVLCRSKPEILAILEHVYDAVSVNGYLQVDGWNLSECRDAILEFRSANGIDDLMESIHESSVWWKKGTATVQNVATEDNAESGIHEKEIVETEYIDLCTVPLSANILRRLDEAVFRVLFEKRNKMQALPANSTEFLLSSAERQKRRVCEILPLVFTDSFSVQSIVFFHGEADWIAHKLSLAARQVHAKVLCLGSCECAGLVRTSLQKEDFKCVNDWHGIMPTNFTDWAEATGFPTTIDILHVDFTRAVQDSFEEIVTWEPLLSADAIVILCGTHKGPSCTCNREGSEAAANCFELGLEAVQQISGLSFDEAERFDFGFHQQPRGWDVFHDPDDCGLSILKRSARPVFGTDDLHESSFSAAVASDEPEENDWQPPRCSCISSCVCEPAHLDDAMISGILQASSIVEKIWQERMLPRVEDIASGIAHAHMEEAVSSNEILPNISNSQTFDFPVFVISNPAAVQRANQTERVLRAAGFTSIEFPDYVTAEEVDFEVLIQQGVLDDYTLEMMQFTPWIRRNTKKIVSLIINHLKCIEIGLNSETELFGVFEDDLMLGASPPVIRNRLAVALAELPASADLLYLEYCFEFCSLLDYNHSSQRQHIIRAHKPACAGSIIFTRKGARRVLRRMQPIFLALDNMYAELILRGELEAYLAAPPILFQDSYFSNANKLGERGIYGIAHRPFSIICIEQEPGDGFDLTILTVIKKEKDTSDDAIDDVYRDSSFMLASSDTFAHNDWVRDYRDSDLILEYSTLPRAGGADHNLSMEDLGLSMLPAGSLEFKQAQRSAGVLLEIEEDSACWPQVAGCRLFVVLKDREGYEVNSLSLELRRSMFLEGAVFPVVPVTS
jgi:O-methyltransferase